MKAKLETIINEVFLSLSKDEDEAGTTIEQKKVRYNKWFKPMVEEIIAHIDNKDVAEKISNFDMNKESHVKDNKWYTPEEAYKRDVQYKLLPQLYEIVQNIIKERFIKNKMPYIVMFSSESPIFPSENKVYSVPEFNELLFKADYEFHTRKKYAEEKYGSADNYWDLEREDKLPEEDKGIMFGYDKTNFKFYDIPNPNNPEDTFSYEPSRYDIGDGNGSIFDYVRSTCSHDEFIEALNQYEQKLYFKFIDDEYREKVKGVINNYLSVLRANLKSDMELLDNAHHEYKELHKKWLIKTTESDRVDALVKSALDKIKNDYETFIKDVWNNCEHFIFSGNYLKYEIQKVIVSELYLPSREAQKAMNEEDYKTYNSVDWAKLRRIWEIFPANCCMHEYINELC